MSQFTVKYIPDPQQCKNLLRPCQDNLRNLQTALLQPIWLPHHTQTVLQDTPNLRVRTQASSRVTNLLTHPNPCHPSSQPGSKWVNQGKQRIPSNPKGPKNQTAHSLTLKVILNMTWKT